jgi:hypothetical protein
LFPAGIISRFSFEWVLFAEREGLREEELW